MLSIFQPQPSINRPAHAPLLLELQHSIHVPPLSAHTALAPSPSSTNSPNPLTNTPSSLSSARFSKSQLRLFSLRAARQPSSNSRHSRASSTISALTNRCRKKEEMRVKFARESSERGLLALCYCSEFWWWVWQLTTRPERFQFPCAQLV